MLPFDEAVAHFHEILEDLARHLEGGTEFQGITAEVLLQGPFSDAMTHAGQLAMLRLLAGDPVAPENFIFAATSIPRTLVLTRLFLSVQIKIGPKSSDF